MKNNILIFVFAAFIAVFSSCQKEIFSEIDEELTLKNEYNKIKFNIAPLSRSGENVNISSFYLYIDQKIFDYYVYMRYEEDVWKTYKVNPDGSQSSELIGEMNWENDDATKIIAFNAGDELVELEDLSEEKEFIIRDKEWFYACNSESGGITSSTDDSKTTTITINLKRLLAKFTVKFTGENSSNITTASLFGVKNQVNVNLYNGEFSPIDGEKNEISLQKSNEEMSFYGYLVPQTVNYFSISIKASNNESGEYINNETHSFNASTPYSLTLTY